MVHTLRRVSALPPSSTHAAACVCTATQLNPRCCMCVHYHLNLSAASQRAADEAAGACAMRERVEQLTAAVEAARADAAGALEGGDRRGEALESRITELNQELQVHFVILLHSLLCHPSA